MFKFGLSLLLSALVAAKDGKNFNTPEYLASSRYEKSNKIWSAVTENTKQGKWHFAGALVVSQKPVFDTVGDELECKWDGCRNKTIHAQGVVGRIVWENNGSQHPYTGMFEGADSGFIRMSVAKPTDTKTPILSPGIAVKLLRDGKDSANFVAMYEVEGQKDLNWFANSFNNHVGDVKNPLLKPGEARFATQTQWIQTVGLSEMARIDQDGNEYTGSVQFPWKLRFEPTGEYNFPSTVEAGFTDVFTHLKTIKNGSVLYKVYAMDQPEEMGGTEKLIGQIKLVSELTTSYFGDEHLYFRHERMDNDLKYKPEWEQYTPKWQGLFNLSQETEQSKCPFANIIDYLQ